VTENGEAIMCVEQIYLLASLLLLSFLSVGVIIYGRIRGKRSYINAGFAILLLSVIFFFIYLPEYASLFSAWAAMAVAIAAYTSIEENRRLRRDNKEREERDRKETLVNEIIKWAMEVANCSAQVGLPLVPGLSEKAGQRRSLLNLYLKYQAISTQNTYVKHVAAQFGNNTKIHKSAREATTKLNAVMNIMSENLIGKADDEFSGMPTQYGIAEKELNDSLQTLLEATAKVKARLIYTVKANETAK